MCSGLSASIFVPTVCPDVSNCCEFTSIGGAGGSNTPRARATRTSAMKATATPSTIQPWPMRRGDAGLPPPLRRRCCLVRSRSRRSRRVVTVISLRIPRLEGMTVRVRFAPSPTGSLHIGSVRTTLYNYFFARQNKGTLVLRIEDTDQDRLVEGAVDSIYDGLGWLGVTWNEGPREGGPHAPYIQSERLPSYQKHAQQLVDGGTAYFCFCSKERLASLRAQQAARKEITRYDGLCRRIDPKEAAERARTESHV